MSLEEQLGSDLKEAMKAKNAPRLACIRQIKSKIQEAVNAQPAGFHPDDAFVTDVISSYAKSLQKGIDELASGGDKTAALRTSYAAELEMIKAYLPAPLSAEEAKQAVTVAILSIAATSMKDVGKIIGAVMKTHKGRIDAADIKTIASTLLSA